MEKRVLIARWLGSEAQAIPIYDEASVSSARHRVREAGQRAGLSRYDGQSDRPPGNIAIGKKVITQRFLSFAEAQAESGDAREIDNDDGEVKPVQAHQSYFFPIAMMCALAPISARSCSTVRMCASRRSR